MFGFFKRKKNTEPEQEQASVNPAQPESVEQSDTAAETHTQPEPAASHQSVEEHTANAVVSETTATEKTEDIIVPAAVDKPAAIATSTESEVVQAPASENTIVIPVETIEIPSETDKPARLGWAARLKQGLSKSRNQMAKSLASVFGGGKIDEDLYEELETVLLTSDMGIEATEKLLAQVRQRVTLKGLKNGNELRSALKEALYELLQPLQQPLSIPADKKPFVIMMAGVNGAGKTTSIGKLAKYFQSQGKSVLLAAGDTFRAAAREQLQQWGERNNVTVIAQESGDSAAVCFDALEAAKARGIDIVLADTAGRLPTQLHLMEEIKKVKRVLQKSLPEAPHEVMLVLDANVGQNAINQVVAFDDALGLTGLIVSKLDGTAKGGILAALAAKRPIPVRFIGVGEGIDDLRPFDAKAFVDALIEDEE
ncbi:MAG: signal recognition particle-docking protein FtsY [Snodgrassella alvi]